MTREQAEDRILEKAKEIREIMKEYSPEWSGYLSVAFANDTIMMNNAYLNDADDEKYPINAFYKMVIEIKAEWVKK